MRTFWNCLIKYKPLQEKFPCSVLTFSMILAINTFLNRMLVDLSIISPTLVISNAASEHLNRLEINFKQYFTSDFFPIP